MDLIQNSGDILNLVIAAAVALFVLFVCWGLFYTVLAVRNVYKITQDARKGFKRVEEVLELAKEQLQAGTFYISLAKEGISKGVEYLREKTGSSSKKRGSNNKKSTTTSTGKKRTSKTPSASRSKKSTSSTSKNSKTKKS